MARLDDKLEALKLCELFVDLLNHFSAGDFELESQCQVLSRLTLSLRHTYVDTLTEMIVAACFGIASKFETIGSDHLNGVLSREGVCGF